LSLWAPELTAFVLGSEWQASGAYIQCLLPLLCIRFIAAPLSRTFSLHEKQKAGLVWQIGLISLSFLGLCVGGVFNNISLGLILYSSAGSIFYIALIVIAIRYSGLRLSDLFTRKKMNEAN
ncbi:hypothetical protein N9M65_01910, partial [Luminiphilus sp.]|nr:hypothetical protein [Luminiphilus sp.]